MAVQDWIQVHNSIQFIWQKLKLTIERFWTVNLQRVGCPFAEKRRNWAFSLSWHKNSVIHSLSSRWHSTLSELTLNSVQKSSMVSWAAVQVQFLSNELNLNWLLSLMPWTELELNFLNFIQLWFRPISWMCQFSNITCLKC